MKIPRQRWSVLMLLVVAAGMATGVSGAGQFPEWPRHLEDAGAEDACCGEEGDPVGAPDVVLPEVVQDVVVPEAGESGMPLLARQAEITASILLLEQQLRQAELIGRLMEIYGPDAMIEILPGEYQTFAATPAGERVAAEMETLRYQRQINRLQLEAEVRAAEDRVNMVAIPAVETIAGTGIEGVGAALAAQKRDAQGLDIQGPDGRGLAVRELETVQVEEISGVAGTYHARVRVGERVMVMAEGMVVDGVGEVMRIDREGMVVQRAGAEIRYALDR